MNNLNIPQLATVKITCNAEEGTAFLYLLPEQTEYLYIITARHCLEGEDFDKPYNKRDIVIERIYNSSTSTFFSYNISDTDVVVVSDKELDIALMIVPLKNMMPLIGIPFFYHIVADVKSTACLMRGYSNFSEGKEDLPFKADFVESKKENQAIFMVDSPKNLDSHYHPALENVSGLSGSGLFTLIGDTYYLSGIVHTYQEKSFFLCTRILAINFILPAGYQNLQAVIPEENPSTISSFGKLGQNTENIKLRARNTVAQVTIPRDLEPLRKMLNSSKALVLHGNAGAGKSAMARALIEDIERSQSYTVAGFTAEQFVEDSLTKTMENAGMTIDLEQILNSPLSGRKVVIWIESFEKLIDSGRQGAFAELLEKLKKTDRIKLLITIREYKIQKFKILYHYELPSHDIFYRIEEFSDNEINQIKEQLPETAVLFGNDKLHELLRNPYYLDNAVRIIPHLTRSNDIDEEAFKKLMWEHIIEKNNKLRSSVFSSITLKRATEMSLFTATDSNQGIIDELIEDNILQAENNEPANRYAPTHDIMEDWALIRHIKNIRQEADDATEFFKTIGDSPSLRRAFRMWLDEFNSYHAREAIDFCIKTLLDTGIAMVWKDELLITILKSKNAQPVFDAMNDHLLNTKSGMLLHYIHLIRTCCKVIRNDHANFDDLVSLGSGWDAMINFFWRNNSVLKSSSEFEYLRIELIKDWGKQIPDQNLSNLPPAAESAANILLDFLLSYQSQFTKSYRRKDKNFILSPILQLLLKLTGAAKEQVKELIMASSQSAGSEAASIWHSRGILDEVRNGIVDGELADQACRYFPDIVMKMASTEWEEKPLRLNNGIFKSIVTPADGGNYWGMNKDIESNYELPSALQTCFFALLTHHPDSAIDFFIKLTNDAFSKNAPTRWNPNGDKIDKISAIDHQGNQKHYLGNSDYWILFRGFRVENNVVQSMLMALEKGLMNMVNSNKAKTSLLVAKLIDQTNNVAVLAVIASVIQAHPDLLDIHSLTILGAKEFFAWDQNRYAQEPLNAAYYGQNKEFARERYESNKLPHRRKYFRGLEAFVADYMFFTQTYNKELFTLLDQLWSDADSKDIYWRKTLHDMDRRKQTLQPVTIPGYENYVQLVPNYDKEILKSINLTDANEKFPEINIMWASKAYERDTSIINDFQTWEKGYNDIKTLKGIDSFLLSPGLMACLAYRDYYDRLSKEQRYWAKSEIIRQSEQYLHNDGQQFNLDVLARKAIIEAVPLLFMETMDESEEFKIRRLLFKLLITRMQQDVKIDLERSISDNLWNLRPEFAKSCWYGILSLCKAKSETAKERIDDYNFGYTGRINKLKTNNEEEKLIQLVITCSISYQFTTDYDSNNRTTGYLSSALRILDPKTEVEEQQKFYDIMLNFHFSYLKGIGKYDQKEFNESRSTFKHCYSIFLLSQPKELADRLFRKMLDATTKKLEDNGDLEIISFIKEIIEQLLYVMDGWEIKNMPLDNFWRLWGILKQWLIDNLKGYLMPVLLFDIKWKEGAEGWIPLKGRSSFFREFLLKYGFNYINSSIKLMSGIGAIEFLPSGIDICASLLQSDKKGEAELKYIEVLVHKCFFKHGREVKGDKSLVKYFLEIVDFLIERGSAKAYLLKEEMIQYR